jgi:hypothetical protein
MVERTELCALADADMYAQRVHKLSEATVAAVRALLTGPDSSTMRMSVLQLIERLDYEALSAMNEINCAAEAFGVDYKDDSLQETHRAVCNAVRGTEAQHG